MDYSISPWVPSALSSLCIALLIWILGRQAKRDDRIAAMEECVAEVRLEMAKEYFSMDNAKDLGAKLDSVIAELHAQNVTLARVEAELKAGRQATLAGVHPQ